MPTREHIITNGNLIFVIEQKDDEIESVYFQFIGAFGLYPIPGVTTIRPRLSIKHTDFQFGNLKFQIYHELNTIVCIRFKYINHNQYFHATDVRTYEIDENDLVPQTILS